MELYIQKYSSDLTILLSNEGEVIGIFEDAADARDAYLEHLNSIDGTSRCWPGTEAVWKADTASL